MLVGWFVCLFGRVFVIACMRACVLLREFWCYFCFLWWLRIVVVVAVAFSAAAVAVACDDRVVVRITLGHRLCQPLPL